MVSIIRGINAQFDAASLQAYGVWSASVAAAGGNGLLIKAAEIQYYESMLAASASFNNNANSSVFAEALLELRAYFPPATGQGPPPPLFRAHSSGFSAGFS